MIALQRAQQVAWTLAKSNSNEIAFLKSGATIYYSEHPNHASGSCSAVSTLIQGIYERFPEKARGILRNRIYSTGIPTELCQGMVKVSAKRLTAPLLTIPNPLEPPQNDSLVEVKYSPQTIQDRAPAFKPVVDRTDAHFMELAVQLASQIEREEQRHQSHRSVAALLVSDTHEVLSWATNSNAKNKTLHAEVNLIQKYCFTTGKPIPKFSRIYTTLKPCKMCSGMIWTASEDITTVKVLFHEYDSGPLARQTVLDQGTLERKRSSRTDTELNCSVEFQCELI